MPVLSIDYSRGSSTAILVEDDLTYKLSKTPSSIPHIFYANRPSREQEFLNLIKAFENDFSVGIGDKVLTYVSSTADLGINLKNYRFCLKNDAFKSLAGLDFMYFSHLHVGSNIGVFFEDKDYPAITRNLFFDEKEDTLRNYFENLNLYPYIQASSDVDIYEEVYYLREIALKNCKVDNSTFESEPKNLIFTTTRVLNEENLLSRFMFLCLESMCKPGFYNFKLDYSNFIGSCAALSFFEKDLFQKISLPKFVSLGCIVSIPDDVTCRISSDVGGEEVFKLSRNDIFTRPLPSTEAVKLEISSKKYGSFDKLAEGGVFGLIIDTRDKADNRSFALAQKKELIKKWENSLREASRGF